MRGRSVDATVYTVTTTAPSRLGVVTVAMLALLLLLGAARMTSASAVPILQPHARVAALPAPFDSWNVSVAAAADNDQRLTVKFDSAILGQEVQNVVWLPDRYVDRPAAASGVVYYLHGTTNTDTRPVEPVVRIFEEENGGYYAGAHRFHTLLDRHDYLVVVLDTAPRHWCPNCWWVDGLDGQGVAAESHLHGELIPLIEALFNTRTDRGGRAILGHSMGGSGALIQGFRHPDRFAFVGATGATVPALVWEPFFDYVQARWLWYLRGQGYAAIDEIALRNIDPLTLSPQMVGSGTDIVMVLGDGCAPDDEFCQALPDPVPSAALPGDNEGRYRLYSDAASAELAQLGVPHLYLKRDGTHTGHIADTYARVLVDRINRVFRSPPSDPETFSYKTVDRRFAIWGYDIVVQRPNDEFLNVLGARLDGTQFTLAGTGDIAVTLPPRFTPGTDYEVVVTREDAVTESRTVTADRAGRLRLDLSLGPARRVDERRSLLLSGTFLFPHTAVHVSPTDPEEKRP